MAYKTEFERHLDAVEGLLPSNWRSALNRARADWSAARNPEVQEADYPLPSEADYAPSSYSKFSPAFRRIMWSALILLIAVSFCLSAIKQVTTADLILRPIYQNNLMLAGWTLTFAVIFTLILGEIGALTLSMTSSTVGKQHEWLFRAGSFVCAAIAIVSNLSASTLATGVGGNVFTFVADLLLTIVPPVSVLLWGFIGERLILLNIDARHEAYLAFETAKKQRNETYKTAVAVFRANKAGMLNDKSFREQFLPMAVFRTMRDETGPENAKRIRALENANPDRGVPMLIAMREIRRNDWSGEYHDLNKDSEGVSEKANPQPRPQLGGQSASFLGAVAERQSGQRD